MAKKNLSITTKVVLIVAALLVALNVGLGIVISVQTQSALMSLIDSRMLDISNTAAAMIDGDEFAALTEDTTTPEYQKIFTTLKYFQDNIECDYIYGVRATGEKTFVYVVDPSDDPAEYGSEMVYTDAAHHAFQGKADVDNVAVEDEWGEFYSSYSPVFNSSGKVVGIIGVDFNREWYDKQASQNTSTIVYSLIISLFVGILAVILAMSGVRKKFGQLNENLVSFENKVDDIMMRIKEENSGGTAAIPEHVAKNVKQADDIAVGDEMGVISDKLQSMQSSFDGFIDYMNRKANTDALTGLNNSNAFHTAIDKINEKIRDGNANFAVLLFDLNGLKSVNDEYGHAVGDSYIIAACNIMVSVIGKEDLFRTGGDEFVSIKENVSKEQVDKMISDLYAAIKTYNDKFNDFVMDVTFSVGADIYDKNLGGTFRAVFKRADQQMYENKAKFYKDNKR